MKIIRALILGSFLLFSCASPLSRTEYQEQIQNHLEKIVEKNETIPAAQLLLISPDDNLDMSWAAGQDVRPDSPFHIASVGKTFTAVLIGRMVEEGQAGWDDPVGRYLDLREYPGLFLYQGEDYADLVTLGHLLGHTSGSADYFEDPVLKGRTMEELILEEPERRWLPGDLIRFTSENQRAIGRPGETYHYSDTGYILLGLTVEKLYARPLFQVLEEEIFHPLGMDQTSLLFYPSEKDQSYGPAFLAGRDISPYESVSMDWAGGGLRSTMGDLALFARALIEYRVLGKETLNEMFAFDHQFMRGIHYGYGFMEYRFGEFFPTLKSLPAMRGHMGILGTQLMMDFDTGAILITNFSSTDGADDSVKIAIRALAMLEKLE